MGFLVEEDNIDSVQHKVFAYEDIHEAYLCNNVDKVQQLATKVFIDVRVLRVQLHEKIIHQMVHLLCDALFAQER